MLLIVPGYWDYPCAAERIRSKFDSIAVRRTKTRLTEPENPGRRSSGGLAYDKHGLNQRRMQEHCDLRREKTLVYFETSCKMRRSRSSPARDSVSPPTGLTQYWLRSRYFPLPVLDLSSATRLDLLQETRQLDADRFWLVRSQLRNNSIRRGGRVLQEKPEHLAIGLVKSAPHDESPVGSAPAWISCALKADPYVGCDPLEDRSGNDNSPDSLKGVLQQLLGV